MPNIKKAFAKDLAAIVETPPPLNNISTIVESRNRIPNGICAFRPFSRIGAKRRKREKESRERQSALNFFWWTRNMTADEIVDFNQNHGGLLSGASFEKGDDIERYNLRTGSNLERVWL